MIVILSSSSIVLFPTRTLWRPFNPLSRFLNSIKLCPRKVSANGIDDTDRVDTRGVRFKEKQQSLGGPGHGGMGPHLLVNLSGGVGFGVVMHKCVNVIYDSRG